MLFLVEGLMNRSHPIIHLYALHINELITRVPMYKKKSKGIYNDCPCECQPLSYLVISLIKVAFGERLFSLLCERIG